MAAAAAAVSVSALKRVDLPTLGRPTIPQLKPMAPLARLRCAAAPGPAPPWAVAGQQRHLVHEAGVVAADQERRRLGDGVEHRQEPVLIGLGEVAQHMAQHDVLVARMADADPDPPKLRLPRRGVDAARPLWPATPPPSFTRTLPGARSSSSWKTMMSSSGILWKRTGLADRAAGLVHEGLRLEQQHALARQLALAELALEFAAKGGKAVASGDGGPWP